MLLPFSFTPSYPPQVCSEQQRGHSLVRLPPGLGTGRAFLLPRALPRVRAE